MISVLNRYLHGYVVTPVMIAFAKKKFLLQVNKEYSISDIRLSNNINVGNFKTVLTIFQSLGWSDYAGGNYYRLTSLIPDFNSIHSGISYFFQIQLDEILNSTDFTLDSTIDLFKPPQWKEILDSISDDKSMVSDFLLSSVLIPLLYVLKKRVFFVENVLKTNELDEDTKNFFVEILMKGELGKFSKNEIHLNRKGSYLLNNIEKGGVALSYYKLLHKMDDLLYGNSFSVFDNEEVEVHLDRTLNVIGSGDQHNIFFDDLSNVVERLCSDEKFGQSLKIADTGCGDGSLLSKIYSVNSNKEILGPNFRVIGVDYNSQALVQAKRKLVDIPHDLLVGDIAKPREILNALQNKGYKQEEILHIRTFLDHNCPISLADVDEDNEDDGSVADKLGVFVDDNGGEINGLKILKNYVDHFKRWKEIISEKGLITLEVFSLDPGIIKKYLEETESLHFDAIHRFSKQYLLPPPYYMISAAEAGLIVDPSSFKKYPRILPYTRISLQHFLPKPYTIRHPLGSDIDGLLQLELNTLPTELRASDVQIKSRIKNYPEGVYLMEKDDLLVGVLYSQRINKEVDLYEMEYDNVESFHNSSGKFVQLISLQIQPSFQGIGYSNELLSFGVLHSFLKSNVKKIVGITRCSSYKPEKGNYEEYIHKKNKIGCQLDPILNFHFEEGAKIVGLVENYRPLDKKNFGNGVHIRYQYGDWNTKKRKETNLSK